MNIYFVEINWKLLFNFMFTQHCWDCFYSHVMIAMSLFISVKVCDDTNQKKWVNKEVKNAVKNKRKAWNKIRKDKINNQALIT